MQSPDGNQLWCPGRSLWSLIVEYVRGSELPKISTALGHSLVDRYTEVHAEAELWHKMWQDNQQGRSSSRMGTRLSHRQAAPLADPPAVKELVRAEVKMLLQTLRERVSGEGSDAKELLFRYKPETVDYALSHLGSCYRNPANPGNADNGSRLSSRCSVQSNAEDEIEAMRDELNVTDIDQVVDRLRSILMEECEALNRLLKHFKGNIKQKWQSQCETDKSEPTLGELRELRGALQMDLELYPSSLASSPTPSFSSPLKELKNRLRLSPGQSASDEILPSSSTTSALRPHPPPPLSHLKPRPPPGAPPRRNSASVKLINNSLRSRTHEQHRSTSTSNGPGTSSPSFQVKPPGNSPIHETHCSIHGPSRKNDLSQMEKKSSAAWRSGNINPIPSSLHCVEAGSYSSYSTDYSVPTTGKSNTQNGQQNSNCDGSLVSKTVQTDDDRRTTSLDGLQSETGRSAVKTGSRRRNITTDRNKNGKDVTQQQELAATCTHPAPIVINGQLFMSPTRPLAGITGQPKGVQATQTELQLVNKFYQPAPPSRVST